MGPERSLRSEAGVILLERLLAVALAGLIATAILSLWQTQQETYFRGSEAAQAQQEARAALQLMIRDLRQAKTLLTAEAGRIVFQSAADADPAPQRVFDLGSMTGCTNRCVRYDRGDGAGAQPSADGMLALTFTYRDASGAVLGALPLSETDRLRVRQLDLALQGQMILPDPDPPFTFTSSLKLRNR